MSTEQIIILTDTTDAAKAAAINAAVAAHCGPGLTLVAVPDDLRSRLGCFSGDAPVPAIIVANDESAPALTILDEAVGHAEQAGEPLTKAALQAQYANLPT